jgi:hypothetical protein
LIKNLQFGERKFDPNINTHHFIFMGDTNFRTSASFQEVVEDAKQNNYEKLLTLDELSLELPKMNILYQFSVLFS